MQGYSFEEVILQGKRTKKYRLAVRFEDPQYGPLALFLNSEAGVFGAEIAEALEQAQAAMGQTEFTGNLCTAVITPESVIVYRNTEDEEESFAEYRVSETELSIARSALFFLPPGAALSFFSGKTEKKSREKRRRGSASCRRRNSRSFLPSGVSMPRRVRKRTSPSAGRQRSGEPKKDKKRTKEKNKRKEQKKRTEI